MADRQITYVTIKGFEVMRMFKKGKMKAWQYQPGIKGENVSCEQTIQRLRRITSNSQGTTVPAR